MQFHFIVPLNLNLIKAFRINTHVPTQVIYSFIKPTT